MKILTSFLSIFFSKYYNVVGLTSSMAGVVVDYITNQPAASIAAATTTALLGIISFLKGLEDLKHDKKMNDLKFQKQQDLLEHEKKMLELEFQKQSNQINTTNQIENEKEKQNSNQTNR